MLSAIVAVLVIVVVLVLLLRSSLEFIFELSITKNREWLSSNREVLEAITPKGWWLDISVAALLILAYIFVANFLDTGMTLKQIGDNLEFAAFAYYMMRFFIYLNRVDKRMAKVPEKKKKLVMIEARTLNRYIPQLMATAIIVLGFASTILLVGSLVYKGDYSDKALIAPIIFPALYLLIAGVLFYFLKRRSKGNLESVEIARKFLVAFFAYCLFVLELVGLAIAFGGVLYSADLTGEICTAILGFAVIWLVIFRITKMERKWLRL